MNNIDIAVTDSNGEAVYQQKNVNAESLVGWLMSLPAGETLVSLTGRVQLAVRVDAELGDVVRRANGIAPRKKGVTTDGV
jgi:hypothetical protein